MADYTPTTDEVRDIYTWDRCVRHGRDDSLDTRLVRAEFDRWLAQERAEAGARALEQAADTLGTRGRMSPQALRDRATDLRGGAS